MDASVDGLCFVRDAQWLKDFAILRIFYKGCECIV